ncbi:unnamed protein product [Linum tenue]|uniref:Uncharacterized protein n=1 Tax=Linum tenue TaxID=586396 RepID=A0AAV0NS42_9ROSI|nr:unnamed protein product [Linum tenue]
MKSNSSVSPSSSPPTPPSPLPISTGPGNQRYTFTPSPSISPPFSVSPSSHTSADDLPFMPWGKSAQRTPSAFSLDRPERDHLEPESSSSCLKEL